jgi:arabinofuranosyltransferase
MAQCTAAQRAGPATIAGIHDPTDNASAPAAKTGAAARRRHVRPTVAVAIAMIAAAFAVHSRAWRFVCDDAYISFRYAENLARHGELVFNSDPVEYVEGYTNFLWVVWLALGSWVGIVPVLLAEITTQLDSAIALVLAVVLFRTLRGEHGELGVFDLLVPAFLVASPEYMVWSHGGLETSSATALVLAAFIGLVAGRPWLASLGASAAVLCRPDSVVALLAFAIAFVVISTEGRETRWRQLVRRWWLPVLVALAIVGTHTVWRRVYYGAWLPNTWAIKGQGALLRPTYGVAYVLAWARSVHLAWLIPLVVLIRLRHLVVLAPIGAVIGYGYWVGGDFMAYSRHYVAATVLLAIVIAWLLADLHAMLDSQSRSWQRHAPALLGWAMAVALAVRAAERLETDRATPQGWLDGRFEGVTAMHQFAQAGLAAGRWMRDNLPGDTLISVGAAGAVPYASGLPTLDAFGLVDPYLARLPGAGPHGGERARPGHQFYAPSQYIKERDPDLACHVGYRGSTPPRSKHVHPSFRAGYVWACIEPAWQSLEDPSLAATIELGYYCCRRPRNRVVGPFGAGSRPSGAP